MDEEFFFYFLSRQENASIQLLVQIKKEDLIFQIENPDSFKISIVYFETLQHLEKKIFW